MESVIKNIKNGEFVIVMDDYNRENEGDLILSAEHITEEKMTFLINHTSGIICVPLLKERANQFGLQPMVSNNTDSKQTAFTISCDYIETGTGVSAKDRALTVKKLTKNLSEQDFRKPGHIFPLIAKSILNRRGHTEAGVELCRLAGLKEVAVIGELMNRDGTMKRLNDCQEFSKKYQIPLISVDEIVQYIKFRIDYSECKIPIKNLGWWICRCYYSTQEYVVLMKEPIKENPLVRIHSKCLTGDTFLSLLCDCGEQLNLALQKIYSEGGILIYIPEQEGRGIGIYNKIQAYQLQQDFNLNTYEANYNIGYSGDLRDYTLAKQIIESMGIQKIRLLTQNRRKIEMLKDLIEEVIPLKVKSNKYNEQYLNVKLQHEI